MNENNRICTRDTTEEITAKLSEENIGAVTVCTKLIQFRPSIDGLVALLSLDYHGIYGPRIWRLYKHICKGDTLMTIAVLRSCQIGIISIEDLNHAIDNQGNEIDLDEILVQLKKRLPNFGK